MGIPALTGGLNRAASMDYSLPDAGDGGGEGDTGNMYDVESQPKKLPKPAKAIEIPKPVALFKDLPKPGTPEYQQMISGTEKKAASEPSAKTAQPFGLKPYSA